MRSAIAELMRGPLIPAAPTPPQGGIGRPLVSFDGLADPDEPGITPKQRQNRLYYRKTFGGKRQAKRTRIARLEAALASLVDAVERMDPRVYNQPGVEQIDEAELEHLVGECRALLPASMVRARYSEDRA